ncbi:hypothetical protein EWH84_11590 [Enterococcus faecium]|uniref:hypothetical protein n=1 Tax=Enterococcus faecium TaxID=1352 RepID=UPI00102257B0|nr:hypothetical protein [Enterococcus faecium]RYJ90629.1 hypothetical protein EWH84_11590 [Enterococcus faecium]
MENRIVEIKGITGSGFSLVIKAYIEKEIKKNKVVIVTDTPSDFADFEKENLTLITDDFEQISLIKNIVFKKIEPKVIYIQDYQRLLFKLEKVFSKEMVEIFNQEVGTLKQIYGITVITSN